MRRATIPVLLLFLVACARAGGSLSGPEQTVSPTPSLTQVAIDHDPSTDTFDGWILGAEQVFVGTLAEIVDVEPWEREGSPVFERELSFVVQKVIKGDLVPGAKVAVFQHEIFGAQARLLREDVGRDVLIVAGIIPRLRSADGRRDHSNALDMIVDASYVQMEDPDGRAVGLRLVSPVAERFGYDGTRATLEGRLRARLPVRLADVSPWNALIGRAGQPEQARERQLGHEEFERSGDPPDEYDYGT